MFKMLCARRSFQEELELMWLLKNSLCLSQCRPESATERGFLCHVMHSLDTICTARLYELSHLENVKCDHVFCISRKWLTLSALIMALHCGVAPPTIQRKVVW